MLLCTSLSQALVAFTIELDNEFEHRMPHRTTTHISTPGAPWLVSMAMWFNCMQFVGAEPISARELEALARTTTNWRGMQRWGYIHADGRVKRAGSKAQEIWRPLFDEIEQRWQVRFDIVHLRKALRDLVAQFEMDLPECMPIVGYGLRTAAPKPKSAPAALPELPLPALLAKALLAFTLEYEREAIVSLAIGANILRFAGDSIAIRDLPKLAAISKELVAVAVGFLHKQGYAAIDPPKRLRLTPKGELARVEYTRLAADIERRWETRYALDSLRLALKPFTTERLLEATEPYPDGWRAARPKLIDLPHFPLVTHRGGFPDGS